MTTVVPHRRAPGRAVAGVLLVTRHKPTVEAVSAALQGQERFALAAVCADLGDLPNRLTREPAAAVLVDIDPEPQTALRRVNPLVARFGETRFVLLSEEFRTELALQAMQVGARHLLLKSAIGADLVGVLNCLVPANGAGGAGDGTVITVLSGSGGCGATTLAFNLANELALATARESLLVDLDVHYGAIAPYLGLQGHYGIGDLLTRQGHIDGDLVRSTAVVFSKDLHVLLSPVSISIQQAALVRRRRLGDVLSACKQAYASTIIDAPRLSRQMSLILAQASTAVLIVFQLTVKDIHVVRATRSALLELGIPGERLVLVANRYDKRSAITVDEAREALGGPPLRLVANDFQSAVHNINYGRPLSETAPSSILRRDVKQLLDSLLSLQTRLVGLEGA